MSLVQLEAEDVANQWATRIEARMVEMQLDPTEIYENIKVIRVFTTIAVNHLKAKPEVKLPYTDKTYELNDARALEIIELFLRGINHAAKKLRDSGKSWEVRKRLLESLAWKLLNTAKLLSALRVIPAPSSMFRMIKTENDLRLMMKHTADTILAKELAGKPVSETQLFEDVS